MKCFMCNGQGIVCGYGYFPGGDPRNFHPDDECCTEAEMKSHAEACARWERGDPTNEGSSGVIIPGVAIACGHRFGIGTYTIRCDCKEVEKP